MDSMDLAEASKYLPELIEAAINGQEVVIAKDDQPVVNSAFDAYLIERLW